jgi:hypothetical protein
VKYLHTLCSTLALLKSNALFFYCTAEMGGGERGKEALASALAKKIRLPIPEKYQRGIGWVGIFFRVAAMALAILHNVIIGHLCVGIVAYERGEMYYNATLCKHSFHRFAYWHKRNGGGGWSEVSFCFVFSVLVQLFATAGTRIAMCC